VWCYVAAGVRFFLGHEFLRAISLGIANATAHSLLSPMVEEPYQDGNGHKTDDSCGYRNARDCPC
jgi:hypothetical protein